MSDDDIAFIADWIDGGCPPGDDLTNYELNAAFTPAGLRGAMKDIAEFEPCPKKALTRMSREKVRRGNGSVISSVTLATPT